MTEQEAREAAERVIKFLEGCGNGDIEAGVGQILGLGSEDEITRFRDLIAAAIRS